MPLSILLPLVVFGIAAIVLAVHLTGNSAPRRFASEPDALAAWNRAYPFTPGLRAELSDDAMAARVETAGGPGLVWSFGADTTARLLTPDCRITPTEEGLRVRFADLTAPRLDIALGNGQDRERWCSALSVARAAAPPSARMETPA